MNQSDTFKQLQGTEIAIIGMAGRFPGANDIDTFWQNLRGGVESISFFSDEELAASGVEAAVLSDPNHVRASGVLEDIEWFDASFFGITPKEAEITDPQQRVFLECCWQALENAGYDPKRYEGSIGVYAGTTQSSYLLHNLHSNRDLIASVDSLQITIGNDNDFLTTRVSYKLNLKGPSINVQTACSTSLVALAVACQSLLTRECDMALAGGVAITVPQKAGYVYQEGGILSPDGHCRAFDSRARGFVGGSGVGIVVLKRLANAIEDGDYIHAVIKGSAINNDGSLKVGYTAPSVDAQAEVISEALAIGDVEPETIGYIEAHGTATELGDPIEIAALTQAFGAGTDKKGFCAIGSLKTNIGHADSAAGVAGLIKTVLALKHKQLPPSLHFQQPNPKIDFASTPFYVNTALAEWKVDGFPRRAGVSSFGIGGTNAHVVLEEAPLRQASGTSRPWQLLALSAKTSTALESATTNLLEHLQQQPDLNLADVAYTLHLGRQEFSHRRMLVCQDLDDAVRTLENHDPRREFTDFQEATNRPVAFMFPGQGAQYVDMGRELYQVEPTFREHVDRCSELLKTLLGLDLRDVLFPNEKQAEAAAEQLEQTLLAQPALFVIEFALAQLWMEWGVHPQAMIGHSIGEYVAACLAGVFSEEDALKLVCARGRLMQKLPGGAMLAVPLSQQEVQPLLGEHLSLAASNGPSSCVVSGPTADVDSLEAQLAAQELDCRRLHASHAFHSEMMDPILEPFRAEVSKIQLNPPQIPYISNVSGTWITQTEATDPSYWVQHLRQTVRFAEGVGELLQEPARVLLEVGPGRTLSTLAGGHPARAEGQVLVASTRHPQEAQSDVAFLLNSVGRLWLGGVAVDWVGFHANERRHRLPLPSYPFERQRYWIEPSKAAQAVSSRQVVAGKKPDIADWFYLPSWERSAPRVLDAAADLIGHKWRWLVFTDGWGLGTQMVRRLEELGQDVVAVQAREQFSQLGEREYGVNPQAAEDYQALLRALEGQGKSPERIVHLWGVGAVADSFSKLERLEKGQELGFYSLLYLAQALGEQKTRDSLEIGVVTSNVQEVTGEEELCPEKATVLGPCRVIGQEYPNIICRSIDIVAGESGHWEEEEIDQLIAELVSKPAEMIVAYRGHYRWVQCFKPVRLDSKEGHPGRLREGGVYLITGGMGGIGLELAEYLAKTVQAKLVLTGRTGLPERGEWDEWLATHEENEEVSRKIRKVLALEELGAQVLIARADVADMEQMREVVNRTYEKFGTVHGVIHSAGVAERGIIALKTPEMAEDGLRAKVKGTQVLDAIFNDGSLDFLVLCSSLSSILGGPTEIDYCAANAFLDAFAHHKNSSHGTFTASINWDAWQEVGMAANTEVPRGMADNDLKNGISSKEGMDVFSRILRSPLPQVLVSTQDLQRLIDAPVNGLTPSSDLNVLQEADPTRPTYTRPRLPNNYVAPRNDVEETLAELWGKSLGIEQLGIHDNFFELGGHSLLALQLISRLREAFQAELSIYTLFNAPTIADLAEFIDNAGREEQEDAEKVARMLQMVEQLSEDELKALLVQEE